MTTAIKDLLEKTTVKELPGQANIYTVNSDMSPYDGFKLLIDNKILSAPVFDVKEQKYTGFLDTRDLVSFVVFIDDDQSSDTPNDLKTLLTKGAKLFAIPVEGVTVTYLSRRNSFLPVKNSDSVLEVCKLLAKGVHRVPVMDDNGKVCQIVSQSTIINFLSKHKDTCAALFNQKYMDLKIGTTTVFSVQEDVPAIEAFRLMDTKKRSGLAVVSKSGALVGNTSGSDLKLFLRTPSLDLLKISIKEFLKKIRQESIDIRVPTITVSSTDSLGHVVNKLCSTKVHRLWVADDNSGYKPMAVVSITDILRHICS